MYANNDNVRGVFKAPANEPITSALDIEEALLFNPEEYTLNKDNNFASQAIPGLTGPLLQFVHGNMRTLEMEAVLRHH